MSENRQLKLHATNDPPADELTDVNFKVVPHEWKGECHQLLREQTS